MAPSFLGFSRLLLLIALSAMTVTCLAAPDEPTAGGTNSSLEERAAAARSVRVITSILGVELGSELDEAHEKLDKLSAPSTPPKSTGEEEEKKGGATERKGEEEEEGHRVLWQLSGTDYSAIYITADDKERIQSITAFLRPDKVKPFDEIGESAKAPLQSDHEIVWDVIRPGVPLFRVSATGADRRAQSIHFFFVQRKSAVDGATRK